ncbi:MAG TPA: hypothetical protein VHA78_05865 [Candidatus Peribacteraceae bacterium]|nr:hypothetical protein [Candidatus Peribacteraceae bacterium]
MNNNSEPDDEPIIIQKGNDMLQDKLDKLWKKHHPTKEMYILLKRKIVRILRKENVLPKIIDHVHAFQLQPTGELVYENHVIGCVSSHLLQATVHA